MSRTHLMFTRSLRDGVIIIFLFLNTSREGSGCYVLIPPPLQCKRLILLSMGGWAGLIAGLGVVVERNWCILPLTGYEYRTPSPLLMYT